MFCIRLAMIRGKACRNKVVVTVAAARSATGSEKKVASAENRAGSKRRLARNRVFRKIEQNRANRTCPRAVVSSTSGYWTARGMTIAVNHLIYLTERERISASFVNKAT